MKKDDSRMHGIVELLVRVFRVIAIVTAVPILYCSLYAHPMLDDYWYGTKTHAAWQAGHSFAQVLGAAFSTVKDFYLNWSGSFTDVFINSLHGGIFGEQYYWICPVIVLILFLAGTYLLAETVYCKLLHQSRRRAELVFLILITLSLNLMVSPVQSIYWWTSAIYYTGFYGCALLLASRVLLLGEGKIKNRQRFHTIICMACSFLLMGGNLLTILTSVLTGFLYTVSVFVRRKASRYQILLIELSLVAGFCTNVLSPGVGYRRSVNTGMGIFPAIGSSIISALTSLEEYSTLIVALLFIPVVFLTIYSVRGAEYHFHYPVLFTMCSFGIYAAQWFPSWYSIGTEGEQRALSICHNLYFWLILLNCIYWCGWYEKQFGFHYENIENLAADFLTHWKKYISAFLAAAAISLASYRSLDSIVGIGAWKLIFSGEGTQYSSERYEQDQILSHSSGKVQLEMVSEEPVLLTVPGYLLDEDPKAWINQRIAEYYGLEEVTGIAPGWR